MVTRKLWRRKVVEAICWKEGNGNKLLCRHMESAALNRTLSLSGKSGVAKGHILTSDHGCTLEKMGSRAASVCAYTVKLTFM